MEKIVIISSQPDKDLIALLNMFFPDCEIRVASSRIEALDEALAGSSEVIFPNINPNLDRIG